MEDSLRAHITRVSAVVSLRPTEDVHVSSILKLVAVTFLFHL